MSKKVTLEEFIERAKNMEDDITINPDMNLGLQSPLETE